MKKIGVGNFACVYLLEYMLTKKYFASKFFNKEKIAKTNSGKESIINEINIMRMLDHPKIIHLYEVFET